MLRCSKAWCEDNLVKSLITMKIASRLVTPAKAGVQRGGEPRYAGASPQPRAYGQPAYHTDRRRAILIPLRGLRKTIVDSGASFDAFIHS